MEWTATRSGKHAIVGYNGHGDQFLNHPASGFRFVAEKVACSHRPSVSDKRQKLTPVDGAFNPGGGTGVGGTPFASFLVCQSWINAHESQTFRRKLEDADKTISPCPLTTYQVTTDYRFIKQPKTNCYISILSEGVTSKPSFCSAGSVFDPFAGNNPGVLSYSFTRQCCYSPG